MNHPVFRIHHVSINVTDIAKSKAFYHELGFVECHQYATEDGGLKIAHLLGGNCIVELFCYSASPDARNLSREIEHRQFIGIDHFSLETDNIDKAYEMLTNYLSEGTGILQGRTYIRYFFINDPDGNRIEIVEDKRGYNLKQDIQ